MKGGSMTTDPINLSEKLSQFFDHWAPRIVAGMNHYQFKLVKFNGDPDRRRTCQTS